MPKNTRNNQPKHKSTTNPNTHTRHNLTFPFMKKLESATSSRTETERPNTGEITRVMLRLFNPRLPPCPRRADFRIRTRNLNAPGESTNIPHPSAVLSFYTPFPVTHRWLPKGNLQSRKPSCRRGWVTARGLRCFCILPQLLAGPSRRKPFLFCACLALKYHGARLLSHKIATYFVPTRKNSSKMSSTAPESPEVSPL